MKLWLDRCFHLNTPTKTRKQMLPHKATKKGEFLTHINDGIFFSVIHMYWKVRTTSNWWRTKMYNPLITHKCSSFKGQNKFTKYSSFHLLKNIKQNLWNNIFTFTHNCYNLPLTFSKSNLCLYWTHSCFSIDQPKCRKNILSYTKRCKLKV